MDNALARNRSLRRKLLVPALVAIAALAILAVLASERASQERLEEQALQRAALIANLVNYVAENTSYRGELQRIVSAVGAEADVMDIVVAGGDPPRVVASTKRIWIGRLLSDLPGEELADDLRKAMALNSAHHHFNSREHLVDYSAPLLLSHTDVARDSLARGAVMVHLDTEPIRVAIRESTLAFSAALLAALLLLSAMGYFLIHRVVLRPVAEIGKLVADGAGTNESAWTRTRSGDELGALAQTLRDALTRADSAIRLHEQQKEAVRESETRYRLIAAYSSDIISRFAADGALNYVSPASASVLGYEPEKMLGKKIFEWIHPDDLAEARQAIDTVLTSFQLVTMTCRMRSVEGLYISMETSLRELRDETVAVRQIVAVSRDITERKAAEVALRDQSEHVRAILDNMVDGIVTIDDAGIIDAVNPAVEQIFGYTRDEMLGRNVSMLMPSPHRENHDQYLENFHRTGTARIIGIGREVDGQRSDGSVFPLELAVSEVTRQGRRMYVGIVRDISERKRIERMKSEFVSAVSHEIRTPMNAVLGYVQLLGYDDNLTEKQRSQLIRIRDAGDHLINIINDVLDLSRIEAGKVAMSIEAVPVQDVLDECRSLTQPLADSRKIALHFPVHERERVLVRADRTRFRQVVLNLLSNAVKYNREGGDVWVRCDSYAAGGVRISVSDNGPGLGPEKLSGLFQPFNRLGAERSNVEGTGIGLTITKHLVELMQGTIGVESSRDKGSTFWIELPLDHRERADSPTADRVRAPTAAQVPRMGRHLALYVEDNPVNLEFVQALCARFWPNLQMLEAGSAEEGLRVAEQQHPDLVLMDINLPGMDGYAALAQLRADPATRSIPVVAVTANAMKENVERARAAGFTEFLAKPIDIDALLEIMDRLLPNSDRVAPQDRGSRILLADDSTVNQEIASALLERLGYSVDAVTDGLAAIEAMQSRRYAAVLMDCEMPVMNGYAATAAIRKLDGDAGRVPVIALTAHSSDETRREREAAGMDDYLSKPIRPDDLQAVLKRWIRAPEDQERPAVPATKAEALDLRFTSLTALLGPRIVPIVDALLGDIPKRLDRMRTALEQGDAKLLLQEAHSMRGSSANLGAMEFARRCSAFEEFGRKGVTQGLETEFANLCREYYERVAPALKELRSSAEV